MTFRDLTAFFLLSDTRTFIVFQIFLLRSIKAYLCPNIINFDSVDFSERRPEEVISLFWRSVYITSNNLNIKVHNIYLFKYEAKNVVTYNRWEGPREVSRSVSADLSCSLWSPRSRRSPPPHRSLPPSGSGDWELGPSTRSLDPRTSGWGFPWLTQGSPGRTRGIYSALSFLGRRK